MLISLFIIVIDFLSKISN